MSRTFRRHGILFVVSAPSGAGKTTLLASLRQTPDFTYSVSCTTRAPRPGEVDGEDYHFINREEFERRRENGQFLEHAKVHGQLYGTPLGSVSASLSAGVDVLIDIDTAGAALIRASRDPVVIEALCDIFIMPPSLEELRKRLLKRGTETDDQVEIRLRNAAEEQQAWHDYRYTIISTSTEEDLLKFRSIMRAERYLSKRLRLEND